MPDPTSDGMKNATNPAHGIVGVWKTSSANTTRHRVRRLSLSEGFWYQRWTIDSVFTGTLSQTPLLEQGSWPWKGPDSSTVVLVPTYRQVDGLVAPNLPDTVRWSWTSASLRWISHRDSLDTVYWHPG